MGKVHTVWSTRDVPLVAVEISCTSIRAYARWAFIFQPGYMHFLTSNFADGKTIQFMIHILSRPTLSITVRETLVKAQVSLWWETEMMEVESGSHHGQTILLWHIVFWQKHLQDLWSCTRDTSYGTIPEGPMRGEPVDLVSQDSWDNPWKFHAKGSTIQEYLPLICRDSTDTQYLQKS